MYFFQSLRFFEISDYLATFGWLIVILLIGHLVYIRNKENPIYQFYLVHLYWKIILGFTFGFVYVLYYQGGDTVAYWAGAKALNGLFWQSPSDYFTELLADTDGMRTPGYYTNQTGRPPSWIYKESASFFVCKVASILGFFSFKSFFALNLLFSGVFSWVSWRFFRFVRSVLDMPTRNIALAILFIPTVGFWCSGIIKDTVVLAAIFMLVLSLFIIMDGTKKTTPGIILLFLFSSWTIIETRSFILISIFIPFLLIFAFRYNKEKGVIIRLLTRFLGITISFIGIALYINYSGFLDEFSAEKLLNDAEKIQKDFVQNDAYSGAKYDLGITDYSGLSMLKVAPNAIFVTLFRPFVWEYESFLMFLNGVENFFLMVLTVFAINRYRIKLLYKRTKELHQIFIFSLIFILILGYFVGFTSGLYGVLARLKAPVLPFFLLLLFSQIERKKTTSE